MKEDVKLEYEQDDLGNEYWYKDGNEVRYKSNDGVECWFEYDKNNNLIHHKISDGREFFYKYKERIEYDKIEISKQEFQRMMERKEEYASVESRFEIMEL